MAIKNHKCGVSKKIKKEARQIVTELAKKEYCHFEVVAILTFALEAAKEAKIAHEIMSNLKIGIIRGSQTAEMENTLNPINREGVGG